MLKTILAIVMLLSPQLAFAGGRCSTCYVKPYVAPVVAQQPVQYYTTQYVYNFQTPAVYAPQGLSLYQAQGLDRALLLDQSRRLAESATTLVGQAISGHQNLSYEALSLDAQQQADATDVLLLREVRSLVQELRAGRQGPQALQAPPASALQLFVNANCISCHSGPTAKGGLDMSQADALPLETLKKMNAKIRANEMPKGKPLDPAGRLAWCDLYSDIRDGFDSQQPQP